VTINVLSPLPAITDPVLIDATTQNSSVPTNPMPTVVLNGAGAGAGGLEIKGGGTTVRGLALVGFSDAAIRLESLGGNRIVGDWFGLIPNPVGDPSVAANLGDGIAIVDSPDNTIGGTSLADRNVIVGFGDASFSQAFNFATTGGDAPSSPPYAIA